MDTKIIIAIIGLLGLFVGSLLNGVGFVLKERYQKIRIINQSIFYLIKLLHVTSVLKNIDSYIATYSNRLKEHPKLKKIMPINESTFNQFCLQILTNIIEPITREVNETFKQNFGNSIIELSNVKPIIAYKLSKISYTEALSQKAGEILKKQDYFENQNQEFNESFQFGVKVSQKKIFNDMEKGLIKFIKDISWSTNVLNFISSRYEIFKIKRKYSEAKMTSAIEKYIEKTIVPMMEIYTKQNPR